MIQQITEISSDVVQQVPVERLFPSETQPRQFFDQEKMDGLAESEQSHGIIQPLLVRPAPSLDGYEIIDGERRWRAAKASGLLTVPVIVRATAEHETLEIQLITNLQRDDLNELEEAAGYQRLFDLRDGRGARVYSVEKIAQKVGKPRTKIYSRLKLLRIPAMMREALQRKEVISEVAEMVGALPGEEMRVRAAEEILKPTFGTEPMNRAAAREHIRKNYTRELSSAPFDQADTSLVILTIDDATGERVAGGACGDCPMRSGNMPEGNPKRPDICTNPRCFEMKCDAHWARLHEQPGKRLLTSAEAAAIFDEQGRVRFDSEYVDLATTPDRGMVRDDLAKVPAWKKLLEALPEVVRPEVVIARDGRGRIRELVKQDLLIEAVKLAAEAAGEKSIFDRSRASAGANRNANAAVDESRAEQQRAEREEQRVQFEIKLAAMAALVAAVEKDVGVSPDALSRVIMLAATHAGHDGLWFVGRRRGIESSDVFDFMRYGSALSDFQAQWAFVLELLLGKAFKSLGASDKVFSEFAKLYELDLKAIERKVRGEKAEGKKPGVQKPPSADHPSSEQEHQWERVVDNKYRCACGAAATARNGKYTVAHEFKGKPCSRSANTEVGKPNEEQRICSRTDCKNPADEGFKMCARCRDKVKLNQREKRKRAKAKS